MSRTGKGNNEDELLEVYREFSRRYNGILNSQESFEKKKALIAALCATAKRAESKKSANVFYEDESGNSLNTEKPQSSETIGTALDTPESVKKRLEDLYAVILYYYAQQQSEKYIFAGNEKDRKQRMTEYIEKYYDVAGEMFSLIDYANEHGYDIPEYILQADSESPCKDYYKSTCDILGNVQDCLSAFHILTPDAQESEFQRTTLYGIIREIQPVTLIDLEPNSASNVEIKSNDLRKKEVSLRRMQFVLDSICQAWYMDLIPEETQDGVPSRRRIVTSHAFETQRLKGLLNDIMKKTEQVDKGLLEEARRSLETNPEFKEAKQAEENAAKKLRAAQAEEGLRAVQAAYEEALHRRKAMEENSLAGINNPYRR